VAGGERRPDPAAARAEVAPGSLKERLAREMREALRAGDRTRLSTLRLLAAAVRNREVEVGHALSDEELQEVARREVRRRREAAEAYRGAGRDDRAETEEEERRVLESFLPAMLSEDEVEALVDRAVAETGATGPDDLGKVMGYVMSRARGRVDGGEVRDRVRRRLGG
jgi:uncharacterized protein YqeY